MREIKFRAWDKVLKKYFYTGSLDNGDIMVMHLDGRIEISDDDTYSPKDFVIEQYTGLPDKNGIDIYEGDIISPCCISASVTHCVVIFVNGMFCKKQIGSELFEEELFLHLHYSEVIGNIHENPELMEAI